MTAIVIQQLSSMILLMVAGILLYKFKYLSDASARGLSVTLTRVAVPCNMVMLMQRPYDAEQWIDFLKLSASVFIILTICAGIFYLVGKSIKLTLSQHGIFIVGGVYSNVIFMGQPLIIAMYGDAALFYCVAIMISCNMYLITVCKIFFAMGSEVKKTAKDVAKEFFTNNMFIAAVIGIVLYLTEITIIPQIANAMQYAATTTLCISMLYIGTLLASADLKSVFKDKSVYVLCFFTLLVMPVVAKYAGGFILSGLPHSVFIVLCGTPVAAALPSFAEMYGCDPKRASEYVFVSTVLSLFTLPLIVHVLL
ncbi:MAG: AEC family transporter [Bacillota bacterium]